MDSLTSKLGCCQGSSATAANHTDQPFHGKTTASPPQLELDPLNIWSPPKNTQFVTMRRGQTKSRTSKSNHTYMSNDPIDYDFIDLAHLNSSQLNTSCSQTVFESLEKELHFDLNTTIAEKSVLLKADEEQSTRNISTLFDIDSNAFRCQHCMSKTYKIKGKALLKHETSCIFNPINSTKLTLKSFKALLPTSGKCPNCVAFFKCNLRKHVDDCMASTSDLSQYLSSLKPKTIGKILSTASASKKTALLEELPFFNHEEDLSSELAATKPFINYTERIKKANNNAANFLLLHLNINSIFNKLHEVDEILNSKEVDVFMINESKLDSTVPASFYSNPNYQIIRLDRTVSGGGGKLVFIKKQYKIKSYELTKFESIYFQLEINNKPANRSAPTNRLQQRTRTTSLSSTTFSSNLIATIRSSLSAT